MHSIHTSVFRKQDCTLFTGSHVHTSFSCVCLIHRRANILQVKHHVNWCTSSSSIASSNVQISFRRFHLCSSYLHTIFTNANPVHKFTSISYTHTPFNCSNVHIPLYDERHRVYQFWICSKRSKSFLRNLVRSGSELLNPWRPIFNWRFWPCSVNDI